MKAVIDRIEGNMAVVLVGESEEEHHVGIDLLPVGAEEGSHLIVSIAKGELEKIELNQDATASAHDRIQKKMERLRKKTKNKSH